MPDIAMCVNDSCILNCDCYRYQATPSQFRQSYGTFQPINDKCDAYLKIRQPKEY
jgi:hypothetical protein